MPKITVAGASHEGVLPGPTVHDVEHRAENAHLMNQPADEREPERVEQDEKVDGEKAARDPKQPGAVAAPGEPEKTGTVITGSRAATGKKSGS